MRRHLLRAAAVAVVGALGIWGALGAYGYGRDYYLHRGFAALVRLPRAGAGRLLTVHFYSPALRREADYLVYLPPGYDPARRYPTYYLLHGMPGQPRVFVDIANMDVRLDNQLALHHARPMILVYPDGRIGGSVFSDSEWANTSAGRFQDYVLEVVADVDQHFAAGRSRRDRVIGGFSAGGYGAMNIALHHLSAFGNVQSWSGYFLQTRSGVFAHASRAALAYNSPLEYARRLGRQLRRYPLRVFMFVGRDDGSRPQQAPMARLLQALGARVRSAVYPGGHDWSVWYPRLNPMLNLASWDVRHPPRAVRAGGAARGGPRLPPPASGAPAALGGPAGFTGRRDRHHEVRLIAALLLALVASALINLGFVLQHRGHARARAVGKEKLLGGIRDRSWWTGQAVGWLGFAGQVLAVALAPLTLVQAFSAGSLALSVPLATRLVGHRVQRAQLVPIALIALALAWLPIGYPGGHGHLQAGVLIGGSLLALAIGATCGHGRSAPFLAVAAGVLYGAGDAAIKADAVAFHLRGISGVVSGWTVLLAVCTLGGFLAFQAALHDRDAVRPLSLMTVATALTAMLLGLGAFGEPLGATGVWAVIHVLAVVAVLACVGPLVRAQQRLIGSDAALGIVDGRTRLRPRNAGVVLVRGAGGAVVLVVSLLITLGLLYSWRRLHWLTGGPIVPDALPLLQLAGFAGQPLSRLLGAGVAGGLGLGAALVWLPRRRRLPLVGVFGPLILLIGSDASYSLARNLPLGPVLLHRVPGLGPWLEGLVVAGASALPGSVRANAWLSRASALRVGAVPAWLASSRGTLSIRRRMLAALVMGCLAVAGAVATAAPSPRRDAHTQIRFVANAAIWPGATPTTGWSVLPRHVWWSETSAQLWRASGREHTWATPPPAGRLFTVYFRSAALHRMADYLVYLPSGYTPRRRLPVFYMLHGMPGRPLAFTVNARVEVKLERLIRRRRLLPMILVFPDGRIGGRTSTDSEWANTRSGRFESYVVDVVHDVDRHLATLARRGDRAIAGLSAGAYGAANIALHRVSLFSVLQVWSGYFTETRTGVFARSTPAALRYNSPIDYVRTMGRALRRFPLRAFLYVGRDDRDASQTPPMAAALRAEGAHVRYAIYAGGHSWGLWAPRIGRMLVMASREFTRRRPATSAPRG